MLVDSGADTTILGSKFVNTISSEIFPKINPSQIKLVSATGESIPLKGECENPIGLEKENISHSVDSRHRLL